MPTRGVWPFLAYAALGVVALARTGGSRSEVGPRPKEGRREETALRVEKAASVPDPSEERRGPPGSSPSSERDRAHEGGRGRHANAPWQIPWRGWKDILWRVYDRLNEDRLLAVAAGVVFFGLLALFPALAAFVSLYGMIADASTIDSHLSLVSGILPDGAVQVLHESLTRLTANRGAGLSVGFIVGLLLALWSANSGMKAVIDALNVAYGEKEKRGFIRLNLLSLVFTLLGMLSLVVAVGAVVAAPAVLGGMGLGAVSDLAIRFLRWPALVVLVVLGLEALYRYAPSRREPQWRWVSVGSVTAAVIWLVGSALFSWYIANFGNYNATYGSLGAAVGMMMWMWLSMIVILVGAELNAETEHQTARDSTVGGEKPLGQRGAAKADTIGVARR